MERRQPLAVIGTGKPQLARPAQQGQRPRERPHRAGNRTVLAELEHVNAGARVPERQLDRTAPAERRARRIEPLGIADARGRHDHGGIGSVQRTDDAQGRSRRERQGESPVQKGGRSGLAELDRRPHGSFTLAGFSGGSRPPARSPRVDRRPGCCPGPQPRHRRPPRLPRPHGARDDRKALRLMHRPVL